MAHLFHVTSTLNRETILAHGLDWTRMGAARGIAGAWCPRKRACSRAGPNSRPASSCG
jgi:hypothetical protein